MTYIVRVRDTMFGTTMWQVMPKAYSDLIDALQARDMFAKYYQTAEVICWSGN